MKKFTKRDLKSLEKRLAESGIRVADVDAANLDLGLIASFNDLLWASTDGGHELRKETISAMCNAIDERLEKLKEFVNKVPVTKQTSEAA